MKFCQIISIKGEILPDEFAQNNLPVSADFLHYVSSRFIVFDRFKLRKEDFTHLESILPRRLSSKSIIGKFTNFRKLNGKY